MELLDLPDEILSKIFCFLSAADLANVGSVCHRLHEIDQYGDHIWKWYCLRDYRANEHHLWTDWSFREFYNKALHKYHYLFGWWKRNVQYYGGLFFVKMESDAFVGYDCLPPFDDFLAANLKWAGLAEIPATTDYSRETFNSLRLNRVFAIKPTGKNVALFCLQPHRYCVNSLVRNFCFKLADNNHCIDGQCDGKPASVTMTGSGFRFRCLQSDSSDHESVYELFLLLHHGILLGRPERIDLIAEEFESEGYSFRDKATAFGRATCDCEFAPVQLQSDIPKSVKRPCIKPGFYNSVYNAHGWEILNFRYSDDGERLEGVKIKGDPNVPAGEISIRVFLTKPITLTEDDQLSSEAVSEAISRPPVEDGELNDSLKTFTVPVDCQWTSETAEPPKFYRLAYIGEGQVARTGFKSPQFMPAVFFGFDDDTFAVLWLQLGSFLHYFRARNVE